MANTTDPALRARARDDVRAMLARSPGFRDLPEGDQLRMYRELIEARAAEISMSASTSRGSGRSLSRSQAGPAGSASDSIDYDKLGNKRIDQAGDLAGDFVQNVDFPKFVRDLLKGVFDANLEVTLAQMDKYIELMKAATASISKFVNAIDDTAAFGYLAENDGDNFGLSFDEENRDENGQASATLTTREGEPVDIGDNQVKAKIMEAKIAMAKEQRALLRETILMGVSRLVVERGTVKAAVIFDIKANETIDTKQKAGNSNSTSTGSGSTRSAGLLGSIFGGRSRGSSTSTRSTQISVASAKSTGSTSLAASITGSVEIVFKSDYFKLDNFAEMYGAIKEGGNNTPNQQGGGNTPNAQAGAPPTGTR